MTIAEAMVMLSLGHVRDSVPRSRGGAREKESFGSKAKGSYLHQTSLGTAAWRPEKRIGLSGEASGFQSLALLAGDIGSRFHQA